MSDLAFMELTDTERADLVDIVKTYVQATTTLKEQNENVSLARAAKKESEDTLKDSMQRYKLSTLNLDDAQIHLKERNSKKAFSKKLIQEQVTQYFKEHPDITGIDTDDLAQFLFDQRPVETSYTITMTDSGPNSNTSGKKRGRKRKSQLQETEDGNDENEMDE